MRFLALLLLFAGSAAAQNGQNVQEIQRALIQRDQQSAEFAARGIEARRALENLHADQLRDAGRPLSPDPVIARQLLPYERERMARESGMASSSLRSEREQIVRERDMAIIRKVAPALPLPGSGGPPAVVDQISAPSIGG